jgi:hypothetical protein
VAASSRAGMTARQSAARKGRGVSATAGVRERRRDSPGRVGRGQRRRGWRSKPARTLCDRHRNPPSLDGLRVRHAFGQTRSRADGRGFRAAGGPEKEFSGSVSGSCPLMRHTASWAGGAAPTAGKGPHAVGDSLLESGKVSQAHARSS